MNQQCKVCGEPAAGFHFGAFTCEGCKSFFGRTYNNLNSIAECKNNRECVINKKNRTSCKACRLRKCFMVGMSKSGSRYGRRSNWFKIHCLLQEQSNNNNNNNNDSSVMGTGGSGGGPGGANTRAEAVTAVATAFFGSGAGLYPGAFFPSHLLGVPTAQQRNGFHQQQMTPPENRRREDEIPPHTPSPEGSIGSSIGDIGDESSRPASALSFLRPPSTHHSTSPFSGSEDMMYQHHTRKLPTPSALAFPPVSPLGGSSSAGSPFSTTTTVFSHQRPTSTPPSTRLLYPVLSPPFSATRPGLTPVNGKPLHLDPIRGTPTGGDLLLYSPALAGVAVEQDQPIDLSVKSSLADRSKDKHRGSPHQRPSGEDSGTAATENTERTCKESSVNPLDLTNKRPAEVPQSG